MKRGFILPLALVLSQLSLAQSKPATPHSSATPTGATATSKLPAIPAEYKNKFQALAIQKLSLNLKMADLENQYKADASGMDAIQRNVQTLQTQMFGELGLSVDKVDVNVTPDGDVTLVARPEKK